MVDVTRWALLSSLLVSVATCAPTVEPACAPPTGETTNVTVPTMMSDRHPDVELKATGNGTVRTAVRGEFVAATRSMRFFSVEEFTPPYAFSGRFRVHERLANGWLRWDGQPITYDHAVVFHPAVMLDEPGGANWNNLVLSVFREGTVGGGIGGVSAELHDPASPRGSTYGVRSGYASRVREPFGPMGTGWHDFTVTVDSPTAYRLTLNGVVVLDVVEREPASMRGDRFAVGLRVDGFDIELDDLQVVEH